jgi:hypothetical protein
MLSKAIDYVSQYTTCMFAEFLSIHINQAMPFSNKTSHSTHPHQTIDP